MLFHFESADQLNTLKVELIKTDLEVALTFAQIASQTNDREKAIRNQQNARKAYDTVVRYAASATLTHFERERIATKLKLLKSALLSLGEPF